MTDTIEATADAAGQAEPGAEEMPVAREDVMVFDLACPECAAVGETTVLQTPQGLAAHRKRLHGVEPAIAAGPRQKGEGPFICPECGREFGTPTGLGSHRFHAHNVSGSSPQATSARRLKERRKTEKGATAKGVTVLVCPECGAEFVNAGGLASHRLRKHGVQGTSRSAILKRGGEKHRSGRPRKLEEKREPVAVVLKPVAVAATDAQAALRGVLKSLLDERTVIDDEIASVERMLGRRTNQ